MDEKEKTKMEEAIETATEKIHLLFVHNGWKWESTVLSPEHTPSREEVKSCIEGLVHHILTDGKEWSSAIEGLIEVSRVDENFIEIKLVFQGGFFFSD